MNQLPLPHLDHTAHGETGQFRSKKAAGCYAPTLRDAREPPANIRQNCFDQ